MARSYLSEPAAESLDRVRYQLSLLARTCAALAELRHANLSLGVDDEVFFVAFDEALRNAADTIAKVTGS